MWYPAQLSAICTCSKSGNNNFCCALKHFCIQLLWYFRFLKHARKGSTTAMSAQKRQAPAARPRSANSKTRSKMTKIPRGARIIRQGYPSKVVDISEDCKPLSSLPFRSGDTLIVEEDRKLQEELQQQRMDNVIQTQSINSKGILMRKVVPADNSCLFTSINALMNNGIVDLSCSKAMREIIAGVVMSDPVNFSEAFMGKTNNAYCHRNLYSFSVVERWNCCSGHPELSYRQIRRG